MECASKQTAKKVAWTVKPSDARRDRRRKRFFCSNETASGSQARMEARNHTRAYTRKRARQDLHDTQTENLL
jgi:hypothetical protein